MIVAVHLALETSCKKLRSVRNLYIDLKLREKSTATLLKRMRQNYIKKVSLLKFLTSKITVNTAIFFFVWALCSVFLSNVAVLFSLIFKSYSFLTFLDLTQEDF